MSGKIIYCLLAAAMLSACATGYQSSGLTGGYRQASGTERLEKVVFSGNGFINAGTVQQYALYRCAEIAKERNKPYFVIYESLAAAAIGRTAELPTVGSVGNKPTAFAFVLFLDEPKSNAKETAKTLRELRQFVEKNNPNS